MPRDIIEQFQMVNVHILSELMAEPVLSINSAPASRDNVAPSASMKPGVPEFNLLFAWSGILLGFLSGLALGLFFHREQWLGGYASFKRRLYRLAHISLFGLGTVNLLFYLTARTLTFTPVLSLASWAFVVGALTMPVCCVTMAHFPRSQPLFAIPVVSLLAGGALTLIEIVKLGNGSGSLPGAVCAHTTKS